MKQPRISPPFGIRDKVGYMLGNVANDLTFLMASMFLQVFYTDVLHIGAAWVGTMFLLARIVDAFTDTAMGRIADRVKASKGGKFKPWLLRMCIPVALTSLLMYQTAIADAEMWLRIAYMFVTYLLWGSVFYTAINIPYGSMASVISADTDDRTALSTFRGIGSLISQAIIGTLLPMLLYKASGDGSRTVNADAFSIAAAILAVSSVVCYLFCYRLCTERVAVVSHEKPSASLIQSVKALLSNRALIGIVTVYIAYLGAQMLSMALNNYIFKDYFNDTAGLAIVNAASFLPTLLLSPFAVTVARSIGKREVGIISAIIGALSYFLLFVLHTEHMWIYVALSILASFGFGLFNLIIWAFVSDVIDDHEVRTGEREDGIIYAVCSFSRKIGQAIASAMGGWSLALIGYAEGATKQSDTVKNGIYNVATLIPTMLYITVALLLAFVYTLSKQKVQKNAITLKARRNAARDDA